MDRASDYESAGRVFESPWARHAPCEVHGSPEPNMVQDADRYTINLIGIINQR